MIILPEMYLCTTKFSFRWILEVIWTWIHQTDPHWRRSALFQCSCYSHRPNYNDNDIDNGFSIC